LTLLHRTNQQSIHLTTLYRNRQHISSTYLLFEGTIIDKRRTHRDGAEGRCLKSTEYTKSEYNSASNQDTGDKSLSLLNEKSRVFLAKINNIPSSWPIIYC